MHCIKLQNYCSTNVNLWIYGSYVFFVFLFHAAIQSGRVCQCYQVMFTANRSGGGLGIYMAACPAVTAFSMKISHSNYAVVQVVFMILWCTNIIVMVVVYIWVFIRKLKSCAWYSCRHLFPSQIYTYAYLEHGEFQSAHTARHCYCVMISHIITVLRCVCVCVFSVNFKPF